MAVDKDFLSDFSSNDFTGISNCFIQKLGKEFKRLHTRDEYELLMRKMQKKIDYNVNHGLRPYGGAVQLIYTTIVNMFVELKGGREKIFCFPDSLTAHNSEQVYEELNKLAEGMKSQKEIDAQFLEEVKKLYCGDKNGYKGGADYIRRLVIRRLREISPEFVCAYNDDGYEIISEGKHKGEKKLRDDIDSVSTKLLILKQFIKQFGWCDGLVGDDDHGRGFKCTQLKEIIENNYGGDWQAAAEGITEEIFLDMSGAANRKLLSVAEDMEQGRFGDKSRTREDLYVFAIAFKMRWHEESIGDDDIRKNLFFDYYCDSLIYELNRGNRWEADISGYGINYKNFVEICYLYSIEQAIPDTADMKKAYNSAELYRFQRAKRMIKKCEDSDNNKTEDDFFNAKPEDELFDENYTKHYVESFRNVLLEKNESDAVDYILENYICKFDRIENCKNLIEEDSKDCEKIKNILCATERFQTLEVQQNGYTWEYSEPEILDDRNPDEASRILELQSNDSCKGLIQRDVRFHTQMAASPSSHIYIYRCRRQFNSNNKEGRSLFGKIRKEGAEAARCRLEYKFFSSQNGMRGNHWIITDMPVLKDLQYSIGTRTAGMIYESVNQEILNIREVRDFTFKPFIGSIYSTAEHKKPLSFSAVKDKAQKHTEMYYGNGHKVPDGFFDDFRMLLLAYDEKLRAERQLMQHLFVEDDPEPGMSSDDSEWIVNRSEMMIAAFRYMYFKLCETEANLLKDIMKSFSSFYDYLNRSVEFTVKGFEKSFSGVSELLTECGFMEINPKSIFDLLLIYSAYQSMSTLLSVHNAER